MADYLSLAKTAPTPKLRARYLAKHKAQKLRIQIKDCTNCDLYKTRNKAVPWTGPIAGKAELVLVGEAPGKNEDSTGEPFVGAAGRILNKCLIAADSDRSRVAILNTLCCRPPKNRDPEPNEMLACSTNFTSQLSMIGVGFGMAMGAYAAAAVLGEDRSSIRLKDVRGKVAWRHNMVWTFTYHPAYILRNQNMAGELTKDLRAAIAVARGLDDLPLNFKDIPVEDLDRPLGDGIHDHLRRKGWVTLNLHRIGEIVTVTKSEREIASLPSKAGNYPIYTLAELVRLGMISKQWELRAETLKQIHMAKVGLGGTIIA